MYTSTRLQREAFGNLLDRPPEAFKQDVVKVSPSARPADLDLGVLKPLEETC